MKRTYQIYLILTIPGLGSFAEDRITEAIEIAFVTAYLFVSSNGLPVRSSRDKLASGVDLGNAPPPAHQSVSIKTNFTLSYNNVLTMISLQIMALIIGPSAS